ARNRRAVAKPMPLLPPVMNAVLWASLMSILLAVRGKWDSPPAQVRAGRRGADRDLLHRSDRDRGAGRTRLARQGAAGAGERLVVPSDPARSEHRDPHARALPGPWGPRRAVLRTLGSAAMDSCAYI